MTDRDPAALRILADILEKKAAETRERAGRLRMQADALERVQRARMAASGMPVDPDGLPAAMVAAWRDRIRIIERERARIARQVEAVRLARRGLSNGEIAERIGVNIKTVERDMREALREPSGLFQIPWKDRELPASLRPRRLAAEPDERNERDHPCEPVTHRPPL